jgi:MerR family copper efflux transcriptional regulator
MTDHLVTITEAARRSGLTPRALRHYEARGLVRPVDRTRAGYRRYGAADIELLRFIRRARDVGVGIDELLAIVTVADDPPRRAAAVVASLEREHARIERRVADLHAQRTTLEHILARTRRADHGNDPAALCPLKPPAQPR